MVISKQEIYKQKIKKFNCFFPFLRLLKIIRKHVRCESADTDITYIF